jgi:hypothetical protein
MDQNILATHFVVGDGLLFIVKKLIPVTLISNIDEGEVNLWVDSGLMDRSPHINLKLPEWQIHLISIICGQNVL